ARGLEAHADLEDVAVFGVEAQPGLAEVDVTFADRLPDRLAVQINRWLLTDQARAADHPQAKRELVLGRLLGGSFRGFFRCLLCNRVWKFFRRFPARVIGGRGGAWVEEGEE